MRGDRPMLAVGICAIVEFTPHARGSTARAPADDDDVDVYPACAGIDLERGFYSD